MNSLEPHCSIQGDLEEAKAIQTKQHDAVQEILTAIGGVLNEADTTLGHLEDDIDLLPNAILRKCQEMADGISHLASKLEEHSPEEQQRLAEACMMDYQVSLQLQERDRSVLAANATGDQSSSPLDNSSTAITKNYEPTEDDFLQAIQGASTLLRDVEAAFRELSEDDAEDIADAALTMARLFLISLQNVHENMTPDDFLIGSNSDHLSSFDDHRGVVIEELDDVNLSMKSDDTKTKSKETSRTNQKRRMKVLWPRIGPQISQALQWGHAEAAQRPLLAVALGLTLWPAAIVGTLMGGSLVLADQVVQDVYEHFQEGPLISNVEKGAAQIFQAGKLGFVVSSVVTKQTWRVVQRQVKRNGGVGNIIDGARGFAVERLLNPIETLGMTWNGITYGVDTATEAIQQILHQREEFLKAQGAD